MKEGKTTHLDDSELADRSSSRLESELCRDDSKDGISILEPRGITRIDDGSREIRFGDGWKKRKPKRGRNGGELEGLDARAVDTFSTDLGAFA